MVVSPADDNEARAAFDEGKQLEAQKKSVRGGAKFADAELLADSSRLGANDQQIAAYKESGM